ncbi:MAG TPA: M23 family metallopeptidase [bacterium]|mgnify:CR=1 FL=1|nr:M23 family metallopeptidase [bacterium]HQG44308.1 M23 family metallopeptidase [bacterium]HQI49259.1 M23 family metallopeptidase [bacterium]HQJ63645.1 M23 family metallopeptidase [bacterium]
MSNKQLKLLYFSLGGTELKEISLGWKKIVGIIALGIATIVLVVVVSASLINLLYSDYQMASLSRSNSRLQSLLADMNKQVRTLEAKLQSVEKQDDDLRVFVDLPAINSDIKKMGVGGNINAAAIDLTYGAGNVNQQAFQMKTLLDNLSQRAELAVESRQEIMKEYYNNLRRLKQTPSIRPLGGGRVTDKFGYRLDPFIDRFKHHEGVDFSAPRGTEVYASADGKVVEVVTSYRPNHDYGKYLLIDHGYGRFTRYAHLESILVKPGQTVSRYTLIGRVGDTGRSTGPHLHYEVIVNGKPVDPFQYIMD